jgi:uncharacterized protein (DUF1697 family)
MAAQYVALLRAINVGGKGKLPMAQLREICADLGCTEVQTYVQSGNVVLRSSMAAGKLGPAIEQAIESAAGFRPAVMIRKPADLVKVLDANPYPDTEPRFLHVGFMAEKPTAKAVRELEEIDCSPEGFTVAGKEIYLDYVNGIGKSKKLARLPLEKKLGVSLTARNLNTISALVSLTS